MILDPLLSVLIIAGIFGSVVTEEQISREVVDDGSNFMQMQSEQFFVDRLLERCKKNGRFTAYENSFFISAPRDFVNCVRSHVNVTQFKAQMAAARLDGGEDIVIRDHCAKVVPSFKVCLTDVMDSVLPCLNSEERESLNILYQTTRSLLHFGCAHPEIVKDFIAGGGEECMHKTYPAIEHCSSLNYPNPGPDAIAIPGLGILPKLSVDFEGCTNTLKHQQCCVAQLEKCENSTTASIMNHLFNVLKNETSCETVLNSQTTVASVVHDPEGGTENCILVEEPRDKRSPTEFRRMKSGQSQTLPAVVAIVLTMTAAMITSM